MIKLTCYPACGVQGANPLVSMPCFRCGKLVGVFAFFSSTDRILTQDAGETFTDDPQSGGFFSSIIRHGTRLIGTNSNPQRVFTSDDWGLTWTERLSVAGTANYSVSTKLYEQDGKLYFHTGNVTVSPQGFVSSDNGTTWTSMTPVASPYNGLTPWPGDRVVLSRGSVTSPSGMISSDDGQTWSGFELPGGLTNIGFAYELPNDNWIVIKQNSLGSGPSIQWTDDDGATWNPVNVPETISQNGVADVAYVPFLDKVVVSRGSRELLIGSADGKEWEVVLIPDITDYAPTGHFAVLENFLCFPLEGAGGNVLRITSFDPLEYDTISTGSSATVTGPVALPQTVSLA